MPVQIKRYGRYRFNFKENQNSEGLPRALFKFLELQNFSADTPASILQPCRDCQSRLRQRPLAYAGENVVPNPIHFHGRLTTENAALIIVDHQLGLMTGVRDYSTGELKHNVVALAKAAKGPTIADHRHHNRARQLGANVSGTGRSSARHSDHRSLLGQRL